MTSPIQCPCESGKRYQECCQRSHLDHSKAATPESLMRSRYAAHVLKLVDYVIDTYHPSVDAQSQREEIALSVDSQWCGLEVISSEAGRNDDEGFVHFKAYLTEDDKKYCLEERSRFVREGGAWYYIDGTFPDTPSSSGKEERTMASSNHNDVKVGRNDPCLCGSGKKYKKCCG